MPGIFCWKTWRFTTRSRLSCGKRSDWNWIHQALRPRRNRRSQAPRNRKSHSPPNPHRAAQNRSECDFEDPQWAEKPVKRASEALGIKKTLENSVFLRVPPLLSRVSSVLFSSKQSDTVLFWHRAYYSEESKENHMADKMTQSQMVKELAEATGTNSKVAKQFMTSFSDLAIRETKKSGMFVIPGIGRLVRVDRKARTGRNPATGEAIKIPAKKVVKFRVAKAMTDAIVPPKKK